MRLLKAAACAVAILACAPTIGGCASLAGGVHAVNSTDAKKAMIDCDTAYIAIATIVTSGVLPPDKQALGESIRVKAWSALQVARGLYAANQSPSIATLAALLLQAQTLQGAAR